MENITFFTYPSCTSCRKTKKWLTANSIAYEERHLFKKTPTYDELLGILSLTTEGLDEILATRSQKFKHLGIDVNELSLSKVVKMLIEDPTLLRRPIITDGKKLIIGHNPDALKNLVTKQTSLKMSS
ncbi:MAG: Spx/MgsR family RNA polymerase-binding regulatory protein [Bacillota bacterium]|nr:Spx/MgsR family RNA polymerase-binding regulatory protein [Bacillota bacterium]MDP4169923.1 Spx/MgsR family RNA polymerase-binding regulatory protein [Bacillota bacterium]